MSAAPAAKTVRELCALVDGELLAGDAARQICRVMPIESAEAPGRFTPDGRLFADEGLRILAGLLIADLMQEYDASAAKRGGSARAAN
jgi:hypothetical protein